MDKRIIRRNLPRPSGKEAIIPLTRLFLGFFGVKTCFKRYFLPTDDIFYAKLPKWPVMDSQKGTIAP